MGQTPSKSGLDGGGFYLQGKPHPPNMNNSFLDPKYVYNIKRKSSSQPSKPWFLVSV